MRCLIIGATGQIGHFLLEACRDREFPCAGTYYCQSHPAHVPLDIRDELSVRDVIHDYQPDVTFLAAGLTDSGYAEAYPQECRAIIADGTRFVAEAVASTGGKLVSFHTDELFGSTRTAQKEAVPPMPSNSFSEAHVEAEASIRQHLPTRHLIIRTSWVFSLDARRRNMACTLLRKLRRGETCLADPTIHGQPTYAPDLAEVALELVRAGETGTIHVAGPERHTAVTFGRLVAHVFGHDAGLIRNDRDLNAVRPADVWLDRSRLRTLLGSKAIRPTADGLRAMRTLSRTLPAHAA